ncbi:MULTISPECIES: YiiX/YebB-like N1pC/P60 family cysteine hydrolase [Bacteroidales]|uniref:Permuted papain-like amidase YaeF/Yiix C92 family enzyme n=1 Tax=Porphyromonas loveana TaxID=1884669 RepID=A0A2U1F948_9PORP|nr:YiiX/YebB-like N1pC/P60 family cysteine hydrolase [Porphyromonas loveana]PVZ08701.1 permuted papain-like amidase YaeF/Yiix C92 family enzyme [Porphyromonas loveana]
MQRKLFFCIIGFMSLLLCMGACSQRRGDNANVPVFPEDTKLRDGDLICRLGTAWYSQLISRRASSISGYSHVGIILHAGTDSCVVLHTEGDTGAAGQAGIAAEPLTSFLKHSRRAGVYRLALSDSVRARFIAAALAYRERAVPFDYAFDSDSDAELYCTEYVAVSLLKADTLLPLRPSFHIAGRTVFSPDDVLSLSGTACIAQTN